MGISFWVHQVTTKHIKMSQPIRLYAKGTVLGYKRSKVNTYHHTSLLDIEGVKTAQDAEFYLGKRVAYIYKAKNARKVPARVAARPNASGETNYRVIWGKITRTHGTSGVVRAKFAKNLPAKTMGASCRIMLYPSNI